MCLKDVLPQCLQRLYTAKRIMLAKYFTLALMFLLTSCASNYDITIKQPPCLLPFRGYTFQLCQDFPFAINGLEFAVPDTFITDLASIPQFLWPIYAPHHSNYLIPSVIHDYLYSKQSPMTRREADDIFYNAMVQYETPKYRAYVFYIVLRAFGAKHYKGITNG